VWYGGKKEKLGQNTKLSGEKAGVIIQRGGAKKCGLGLGETKGLKGKVERENTLWKQEKNTLGGGIDEKWGKNPCTPKSHSTERSLSDQKERVLKAKFRRLGKPAPPGTYGDLIFVGGGVDAKINEENNKTLTWLLPGGDPLCDGFCHTT